MTTTDETQALAALALDLATTAGRLVVDDRPAQLRVSSKSTATDPVTEMDQRAQALISALLQQARPHDGLLGEESGGHRDSSTGLTWIIDPIDGTVNYVYGIPAYSVSVAVAMDDPATGGWIPIAGAVVNPVSGERYWAGRGIGAWRALGDARAVPISTSTEADLGHALVATGFGYSAPRRAWQAEVLTAVLPEIRDIRRIGSAALDLCRVADGSLDGYYEVGLNPWDLAAGWLLVTEAGGQVTGASANSAPGAALTVAGNARVQGKLRSLVVRAHESAGPCP